MSSGSIRDRAVAITFRIARPAGHSGRGQERGAAGADRAGLPRDKPDIDKLARSTLDSLTGIVSTTTRAWRRSQLRSAQNAAGL